DELRMGVIGCGGISRAHLPAQRDVAGIRTVAVCDIDEDAVHAAAHEYDVPKVYTDWRDLIADDDVDAVAVLLPHHLHREPTVAAARAGKHVLCEKPMATSLDDCDAMIAAADEAGVVLMVAQILRFRPVNITARDMIGGGAIGEVRNVLRRRLGKSEGFRSEWARRPEEAGGWVLYGFGSHEVDMILWLTNSEARAVFAQARRNNPYWNDYDEVTIQMALSNGAMATYQHSLNCPYGAWECIVIGTEGAMKIETERIHVNDQIIEIPHDSAAAFRNQVAEFLRAVREGDEPEASGHDVRSTYAALEAAKLSIRDGVSVDASSL
ncbi:MAG: Gfo/Idh/MocA family oxidoreductase, partial [Anaerolineae bacterium]|nr:Gfo/Idh/MocA family oxidoreductase [Anaerolineae bacterium]